MKTTTRTAEMIRAEISAVAAEKWAAYEVIGAKLDAAWGNATETEIAAARAAERHAAALSVRAETCVTLAGRTGRISELESLLLEATTFDGTNFND